MTTLSVSEPKVHIESSLPKGYKFVRKGHVYITKNCRKLTQEAGKTVYVVEDDRGRQKGIRVPYYIYNQVLQLNAATKDARAEAVAKKDFALEMKVRSELMRSFPRVPSQEVTSILKHTLRKRSGRVGRSTDIPIKAMVDLAVRAHIRHVYTDYDQLLKRGVSKEQARKQICDALNDKICAWGGGNAQPRGNFSEQKQSQEIVITVQDARKPVQQATTKLSKRSVLAHSTTTRSFTPAPVRRRSLRLEELRQRRTSEDLDMWCLN